MAASEQVREIIATALRHIVNHNAVPADGTAAEIILAAINNAGLEVRPKAGICHVCKNPTDFCCSDCAIDLGANVYVCVNEACRRAHDLKCPHQLEKLVKSLRVVKP